MTVSEDCKLVVDWIREPDHAEKFTFNSLNNWLDRRPVAEVARLTAALSDRVVAASGWQDISTAPKDGTRVHLWSRSHGLMINAYWEATLYCPNTPWGWGNQSLGRITDATHWQPSPAPPPASTAGEVESG